ncbi:MAG: hypothetical protein WBN68_17620 [Sedimenticolaceae bacterium]
MIGKVLFTLGVVLVVALIWRTRAPRRVIGGPPSRVINMPPERRWPLKGIALGVVALMLITSAYLLYQHWRDSNEIIFIRVVDARSGHATEYRAQRGDIQDREFITTDGRRVVLAETERLETSTISSPVQN